MNDTMQVQLRAWCMKQSVYLNTPQPKSLYALPNGDATEDRAKAREAWEIYQLQRNAVKCHCAGKNKYCAGRL